MKQHKWNYLYIQEETLGAALNRLMEAMNRNYPAGWEFVYFDWKKIGKWYEVVLIFTFED